MLRVRFRANIDDPRPITWPVKHPYWVSGEGDGFAIVISYADDEEYIRANWPESSHLESEEKEGYTFTDRFPKPAWFGNSTSLVFDTNAEAVAHRDEVVARGGVDVGVISYAADNAVFYGVSRVEDGGLIALAMSRELAEHILGEEVVGKAIEAMDGGVHSEALSELLVELAEERGILGHRV